MRVRVTHLTVGVGRGQRGRVKIGHLNANHKNHDYHTFYHNCAGLEMVMILPTLRFCSRIKR